MRRREEREAGPCARLPLPSDGKTENGVGKFRRLEPPMLNLAGPDELAVVHEVLDLDRAVVGQAEFPELALTTLAIVGEQ